ncbi:hypothetical protein [Phenylobacterium soli]|uniref:Uncharacterized protein n=1 Tax=Phenylobacterium soli TaxID=2170551 RepID=A0A328AN81_9CAUL|nr:hypothetical protein [Phenylobacterium soli]RAK54894.1 hypothetical protein DJ017_10325 [Phenylobacterium soli]
MSFEEAWGRAAPLLDPALAHAGRTHRLDDVRGLLARGEAQLWLGSASAAVTLVEADPCERRLLIWLAGGELDELRGALLPQMERWGRGQGCRRLLIVGRAGWERALKPDGYAPLARVIAKDL